MLREKLRKDWSEIKHATSTSVFKGASLKLKLAVSFLALALLALGIVSIKRPVPPELRGQLHARGRLVTCDIHALNKMSREFFVGMTVDAPNVPMIRANPELAERASWEKLCALRPTLDVYYHAQHLLIGDIKFWLDRYEVRN